MKIRASPVPLLSESPLMVTLPPPLIVSVPWPVTMFGKVEPRKTVPPALKEIESLALLFAPQSPLPALLAVEDSFAKGAEAVTGRSIVGKRVDHDVGGVNGLRTEKHERYGDKSQRS